MDAMHSAIPESPEGRRAWIVYQLRLVGFTLGTLAVELGVKRSTTRTALGRPYPRMERAIAEKLGLKPEAIWPERYDSAGHSLVQKRAPMKRRRPKSSHARASIRQTAASGNGKTGEP